MATELTPETMTNAELVKARALAQMLHQFARDEREQRAMDDLYQRLRNEEIARKVAKRLDQAINNQPTNLLTQRITK